MALCIHVRKSTNRRGFVRKCDPRDPRGGEAQLLALARVLVAPRGVVVLDEATAALDSFWWRPIFMVAAGVALAALTASSVGVTPETAPWLARRGRVRAAASTLTRTRNIGRADAEAEARELATASAGSTAGSQSMLDLLRPEYRRMALTGIGLSSLQALSGANALVYFTATIFTSVGVGSPGMAASPMPAARERAVSLSGVARDRPAAVCVAH